MRGLEECIDVACTKAETESKEWVFDSSEKERTKILNEQGKEFLKFEDPIHKAKTLREVYTRTDPNFKGPATHPVLIDKTKNIIVNNVSSQICKMLCTLFNKEAKNMVQEHKGFF